MRVCLNCIIGLGGGNFIKLDIIIELISSVVFLLGNKGRSIDIVLFIGTVDKIRLIAVGLKLEGICCRGGGILGGGGGGGLEGKFKF